MSYSDSINYFLKPLGLSELQGRVYLAALELGEAKMQDLAKKSGVNRTTIYTFIDDLKERGFITETKRGKRRIYSAIHPERFLQMQKVRTAELEKVLPELLAIHNVSRTKPRVTFYEGVEGVKEVYTDILRDKKEMLAYEDIEHLKGGLPQTFYEYFPAERAKKGISIKSISRDSQIAREFIKDNIRLLRETRFIKVKDFKTDINIYGNKIALIGLRSSPPFAVIIEDVSISETMRIVWKELWDRLKE